VLLVLDDWRLTPAGAVDEASFRSFFDASHGGRMGGHFTVNGAPHLTIPVKTNERLRLRLVNAANARVMSLRIDRHRATVMAVDGQPAEPFAARDGGVVLAPGTRVDLFVDATLSPGAKAPILIDNLPGEVSVADIVYAAEATARQAPRESFPPLPPNPLPARIDVRGAFRLDVPLDGGMMAMMGMRGGMGGMMGPGGRSGPVPGHGIDPTARIWTVAGIASSGHDGPPMFSVERGRTVILNFINRTVFPHGMHVHGHHFRLLNRFDDGWKPYWRDTVLIEPMQSARIAFIADNPGKWMLHCHMLEHQETGMAAWFEVG
jgi:FtsP/CotA-like multicopper oxidase with cupredoxin domain